MLEMQIHNSFKRSEHILIISIAWVA
uniref:Uncharacterized protein n=1 Tax=Arundo donax TaxID=35708 RepID=A0A0A9BCK8_ARUDO